LRAALPPVTVPRAPFAFIWHYMRGGFRGHIILLVLLIMASAGVDTGQTYVLGSLVNAVAGKSSSAIPWFAGLCATWLTGYLFNHAYNTFCAYTQIRMRVRMHDDLFAYLLDHAPRYFLDQISSALAHRIRTAANSAVVVVDYVLANIVRFSVLFAVTGLMIRRNAPQLLWVAAVFLVIFTAIATFLAQRMRVYAKASSHASSEQVARMSDVAANWELVRSFASTIHERLSLRPISEKEATTFMQVRLAATVMRLVLHTLSFAFLAWLAWSALGSALRGAISVGTFTMLVSLFMLVSGQIRTFGDNLFVYFEHLGMMTEALDTVLAPHEIVDPPGARMLRVTAGAISIRNLTFSYPDGTPVFRDFSLDIAGGQRVGLVGASGAGKSTLIKLFRRQFPVQSGIIEVDGYNIAGVTWDSLHDAFGEVPQVPGLFHRSVRENIAYGRPGASEAEIIAAAKAAHCHEFIVGRAAGYASVVGEKGMKLSGGERQRVAIARAFLKDAPILLLDEATSSLDSEAEHLIQEALLALMRGRTVIAIAHRLSTIMHLDRIVVLDGGVIVEHGRHADLLQRGGVYARLWQRQAGGFI
jgi:ATP-binding cassette subfamily B protein